VPPNSTRNGARSDGMADIEDPESINTEAIVGQEDDGAKITSVKEDHGGESGVGSCGDNDSLVEIVRNCSCCWSCWSEKSSTIE